MKSPANRPLTRCGAPGADKESARAHSAAQAKPNRPAAAARGEYQVSSMNQAPTRGESQKSTAA